jgi:hypothetical protein
MIQNVLEMINSSQMVTKMILLPRMINSLKLSSLSVEVVLKLTYGELSMLIETGMEKAADCFLGTLTLAWNVEDTVFSLLEPSERESSDYLQNVRT